MKVHVDKIKRNMHLSYKFDITLAMYLYTVTNNLVYNDYCMFAWSNAEPLLQSPSLNSRLCLFCFQ